MKLQTVPGEYGTLADVSLELRKTSAAVAAGWQVEHEPDGTHKPGIAFVPRTYPATVASAVNTTTETTLITFDVGADEMADGDVITVTAPFTTKNGSGAGRVATIKVYWGRVSVALAPTTWSNGNVDNRNIGQWVLVRVGADLWVRDYLQGSGTVRVPMEMQWGHDLGEAVANTEWTKVITAPPFDQRAPVSVSVALATAHAAYYWKIHSARVVKVAA